MHFKNKKKITWKIYCTKRTMDKKWDVWKIITNFLTIIEFLIMSHKFAPSPLDIKESARGTTTFNPPHKKPKRNTKEE